MDEKIINPIKESMKECFCSSNDSNSLLILFTGISGAGKTTLANSLAYLLQKHKIKSKILDGDSIRSGINKDLGYSPKDRSENNRRIGEISKLFLETGIVVMAAIIAPYKKDREIIKKIVSANNYVEIFVNTSLETCEKRDSKGLYKKARAKEIKDMTGISAPYEVPENPDIEFREPFAVDEATLHIYNYIKNRL